MADIARREKGGELRAEKMLEIEGRERPVRERRKKRTIRRGRTEGREETRGVQKKGEIRGMKGIKGEKEEEGREERAREKGERGEGR